jgi:[NiFe] hydrogenase diaphorase moiety small subunit
MTQSITIDGVEVPFEAGQTIMDAALAADIYIPHLCHRPGLSPHGSCKLCSIEVDGRHASACTLPAQAGQQISNNTEALNAERKTITQMLFVEGNHFCPACEKTGDCTLQAVAYHLDMLDGHFPQFYPHREVDASHPDMVLDRDRCILCALCVRAAQTIDGKDIFAITGRGMAAHLMVNTASGKLGDSSLTTDDLAAHICPVGALMMKSHAYETPIGRRTFDLHTVAEPGVEPCVLSKDEHHEA